jgi:hypothetical protein
VAIVPSRRLDPAEGAQQQFFAETFMLYGSIIRGLLEG